MVIELTDAEAQTLHTLLNTARSKGGRSGWWRTLHASLSPLHERLRALLTAAGHLRDQTPAQRLMRVEDPDDRHGG